MNLWPVRLSLTERIQRASFALTMLIIVTLGSVLLGMTLLEIPKAQIRTHQSGVSVIGDVLTSDVNDEIEDLRNLSKSPLVWTSLTDSAGRNAYLKPFLESRARPLHGSSAMLVDYRARPILGQLSFDVGAQKLHQSLLLSIGENKPRVEIFQRDKHLYLVLVFPVVYPYTQDAIGALAGAIDLGDLLLQRTSKVDQDHGLGLFQAGRVLMTQPSRGDTENFPVSLDLPLSEDVRGGPLTLRLYGTDNPWLAPVLSRVIASAVLALLMGVLTWKLSGLLAQRITGRLNELVDHCQALSEHHGLLSGDDSNRDEIDLLSKTLRKTLKDYETVNTQLESLVDVRTRQLSESEERFRNAIEALDQPFVIFDPDDKLVYCNQEFQNEYSLLSHLMVPGQSFEAILRAKMKHDHPDVSASEQESLVRERLADHIFGDVRIDTTGPGRWVRDIQRRTSRGYTVGLRLDISELILAKQQAEAANVTKSQFLATMSHELRTPLNGILVSAQLMLSDEGDGSGQRDMAQAILDSGEGLLSLLNDLLLFSNDEIHATDFVPEPVQIDAFLLEVTSRYQRLALKNGLSLDFEWTGARHQWFLLDRHHLTRALEKLLDNAFKFTHQGGVRVEASEREDAHGMRTLKFSVTDTGIGIDHGQQEGVFKPFVQLDPSSTRHYGGAGMGLSIVWRLSERMGGTCGLDSLLGHGTTAWIEVPARSINA
jgi:signal transduction histidine kinase